MMDFQNLKDFMDRLTSWRIPGNDVSVCLQGKEVFRYRSGYSDVEKQLRMRSDSLYFIYSCSKVCTVTAALQLYEKGYFLLDTPLYEFIPAFRHMTVKTKDGIVEAKKTITMRHLFTMSSGLSYNLGSPSIQKKARDLTGGKMDTLTVINCLAEDPLQFEPGESWLYGLSHDVLGAVVESISGKKFRDYVRDHIFLPLDMRDSSFHCEAVLDRVAPLYNFKEKETDLVKLQAGQSTCDTGVLVQQPKVNSFVFGPEYDCGGAGIITSVSDYSKFVSALACGGVGQTGEQIISAGTIDLLRTNQLSEAQAKMFNWKQLAGCGYGLGVRTLVDKAASGTTGNVGEFGWGGAAGASVLVDPSIGLSVFYTHHMLNPQEEFYQPRLRNVVYGCL